MRQILQNARTYSPYLLVELLVPGGTLVNVFLWFMRRKLAAKRGSLAG